MYIVASFSTPNESAVCTHIFQHKDTVGFYEKYFEGKPWSKKAQQIVDEVNPQIVGGRWTEYPERPSQDAFQDWLFGLQNKFIANRRSTYHSSPDPPLAGSECKRKPDIFLAHFDASNNKRQNNWAEVQVIGELKQSKIRGMETAELLKFCGNAREVFASQPTRRFLHGFIIRGSHVELRIFDRSGLYSSEQFDIEVLEGKLHTYRHDLESLFYVFLWVIIRNGQEHVPNASHLRNWYRGSYAEIAAIKTGHMDKKRFTGILDEFPPVFEGLKGLVGRIRNILFPYMDGLFTGTYQEPGKL